VYKDLEGKETAILGWQPAETAYGIVLRAIEAFRDARHGERP
jgi:inorganic pyrophosphatase